MENFSSSIASYPVAVYILETPSSSIDERLNALRFIQQFVENEQISTFTDKIRINQLVLDNVMMILHREDLIPDLRRRQLIRTECFLMLARVLESKSLFGGTKVESSETTASIELEKHQKQREAKENSYKESTVHDPSKDLYHSLSVGKDPMKVGKYSIFNSKDFAQSKDDIMSGDYGDGDVVCGMWSMVSSIFVECLECSQQQSLSARNDKWPTT